MIEQKCISNSIISDILFYHNLKDTMNTGNISKALQDLIIGLQDAEKGFLEIRKATTNVSLQKWMDQYAVERHKMHKVLEGHVAVRGEEAKVKTSLLGDLHRIFIDIKLSAVDDEYNAIVNEIERGSTRLIKDYETVLKDLDLSPNLKTTLIYQQGIIKAELEELKILQKELNALVA